jgi:hypothetical protein
VQRADRRPAGECGVGSVGLRAGALGVERDDGVEGRVQPVDAVEVGLEQFAGRHLPRAQ